MQQTVRVLDRLPLPRGPAFTVLGYHRIASGVGHLGVEPSTFESHMAALSRMRDELPVLHLGDAMSAYGEATQAPERAVVVTFDDGWADMYEHALPVLTRYEIPATLFVPSRLLGRPEYITRFQLTEIAEAGVRIGAHTRTHPDLRTCSDRELEGEVRGSRADLEDLIGAPVTTFAYPKGLHDDRVVAAVRDAGYQAAVTTKRGWARPGLDGLRIPRSFIEDFDAATFEAAARGAMNSLRPVDAAVALLLRLSGRQSERLPA